MTPRLKRIIAFLAALAFCCSPWLVAALLEHFSECRVLDRMNAERDAGREVKP